MFLGEFVTLGPNDADVVIAIEVGDDDPTQEMGPTPRVQIRLPIDMQGIARADLDEPWIIVEQVISDIKKAIELTSATWLGDLVQELSRGPTRTLEREEGSTFVGAVVGYEVLMYEDWGAP